ncbi:MAG: AAA family ATPase [Candidatus Krumholzibacteria bacterium]|nr:AAA family ATPase [Candidatus Krumholzibacteria bacterium]
MGIIEYLKALLKNLNRPVSQADLDRKAELEKKTQMTAAKGQAAVVDGYIDDVDSPDDLAEMNDFQSGVDLLRNSAFPSKELLELSNDPSKALWQMGVMAVSQRDSDPELVAPLLRLFDQGGPWHKFFVMKALLQHTPFDRSLAGELFFKIRDYEGPWLDILINSMTPVLTDRLADGEKSTFGELLEKLDVEKGESLRGVLTVALDSPLKDAAEPLQAELDQWRAAFIDRDVLQAIGRIWDPDANSGPLVIDHPQLAAQVQDVLRTIRQTPRRSVLLTGEHGVGKTAVARQVGRELMDNGWIVFEASGSDMTAGQRYFGDLDQRIKELVKQLSGGRQVLWYVPDFQSLSWAGTHDHSRSSILDIIMPLLESGEIIIVGELPAAAFEQLAQDKPRLLTSCEVYRIKPLGETATLELAAAWSKALGPKLLTETSIHEAWLLARQYLRDREPPGCLMSFLDQARMQVLAESRDPVQITRDDLITTLIAMTSLPRQILDERQMLDPEQLRAFFSKRILGQPEAVNCLIERITLIKAGLTDPSRPQGVFLFAGPTGTGKTEIAKALASYLFGSEDRLLRHDMSEFQTPESLERLVGDGQNLDRESLTLKIRKQPFSVILLDEFEKAHPKVWDLFLQVFDDGRLTDPMGRTSDFRHSIIILTSNLGGQAATGVGLGFDQDGEGFRAGDVGRAVEKAFRPEFLNRLDRVIVFRPFTREIMREILDKELHDVQKRRGLRNRQWDVVWEDSALEFLLNKGFSPTLGARPLKRAIERYLLTPLAETIVKGEFPAGDQFLYIQARENSLLTEFINPEAEQDNGEETEQEIQNDPCTPTVGGVSTSLAAIALNPKGTPAELEDLTRHWRQLCQYLESPGWKDAKSLALSMTALPEFWSSTERYAVLGEVEYRERVESGVEAAGRLLPKIALPGTGPKEHYPRKLVGQAAGRFHLLELACRSLESRSAWEAFIRIESKQGPGIESKIVDEWVDRLGGMYRQWGQRRKMRVRVLEDVAHKPGSGRSLMLGVSGYAAYDILASETGLHVWEEPDPRKSKASIQHKVLVRVAPMPEDSVAERNDELLRVAREVMREPMAGAPPMVRIYRELPDPLVKDRSRGWRTGRLDRVLEGDFDLLGACAGDPPTDTHSYFS